MVEKIKKSNNMKKISFCLLFFIALFWLCSACTLQINTLNQKTIKKCSACEKFLGENKIYETAYREYDRGNFQGDIIPITENSNNLKTNYKAAFIDYSEVQYIALHTFCFAGMKKSEVESRFGKSLGKSSGPNFNSKTNSDEWVTWYSFKVGSLDKNGKMYVDSGGGFVFDYDLIKGDTLYRAATDDVSNLKKCLDAEGIKYKE